MDHVFWVIPNSLAGRPGPLRTPWSLDSLKEAGFNVVINLSEVPPDKEDFEKLNIDSFWCPLPTAVPADRQAELDCIASLPKAFEYLVTSLNKNHKVLVHCKAGKDRTGLLLSYFFARTNGISSLQSITRIREINPEALSSEGWEAMAINVLDTLCNPHSESRHIGDAY